MEDNDGVTIIDEIADNRNPLNIGHSNGRANSVVFPRYGTYSLTYYPQGYVAPSANITSPTIEICPTSSLAVSIWLKPRSTSNNYFPILSITDSTISCDIFGQQISGITRVFVIYQDGVNTRYEWTSDALATDIFTHFFVVWDITGFRVYVNSILAYTKSANISIDLSHEALSYDSIPVSVYVDELSVWIDPDWNSENEALYAKETFSDRFYRSSTGWSPHPSGVSELACCVNVMRKNTEDILSEIHVKAPIDRRSDCNVTIKIPALSETSKPQFTWWNSNDLDGDAITYELAIAPNGDWNSQSAILVSGIAEGELYTSYTLEVDIEANVIYEWRVRAYDGFEYSNWSASLCFIMTSPMSNIGGSITILSTGVSDLPSLIYLGGSQADASGLIGMVNVVQPSGQDLNATIAVFGYDYTALNGIVSITQSAYDNLQSKLTVSKDAYSSIDCSLCIVTASGYNLPASINTFCQSEQDLSSMVSIRRTTFDDFSGTILCTVPSGSNLSATVDVAYNSYVGLDGSLSIFKQGYSNLVGYLTVMASGELSLGAKAQVDVLASDNLFGSASILANGYSNLSAIISILQNGSDDLVGLMHVEASGQDNSYLGGVVDISVLTNANLAAKIMALQSSGVVLNGLMEVVKASSSDIGGTASIFAPSYSSLSAKLLVEQVASNDVVGTVRVEIPSYIGLNCTVDVFSSSHSSLSAMAEIFATSYSAIGGTILTSRSLYSNLVAKAIVEKDTYSQLAGSVCVRIVGGSLLSSTVFIPSYNDMRGMVDVCRLLKAKVTILSTSDLGSAVTVIRPGYASVRGLVTVECEGSVTVPARIVIEYDDIADLKVKVFITENSTLMMGGIPLEMYVNLPTSQIITMSGNKPSKIPLQQTTARLNKSGETVQDEDSKRATAMSKATEAGGIRLDGKSIQVLD